MASFTAVAITKAMPCDGQKKLDRSVEQKQQFEAYQN
jgi:hypothetical protein